MGLTAAAAWWFLPLALPISIWVAWNDMKFMKIPNKAVYALVLVYLLVGLIALPLPDYAWRMTHLLVVLAIGFVANMAGLLGAGDAKFAAAMAPFVALADVQIIAILFSMVLLGAFATHRGFRAWPAFRRATPDWASWERRDFPMGFALGGTLTFYLIFAIVRGL